MVIIEREEIIPLIVVTATQAADDSCNDESCDCECCPDCPDCC